MILIPGSGPSSVTHISTQPVPDLESSSSDTVRSTRPTRARGLLPQGHNTTGEKEKGQRRPGGLLERRRTHDYPVKNLAIFFSLPVHDLTGRESRYRDDNWAWQILPYTYNVRDSSRRRKYHDRYHQVSDDGPVDTEGRLSGGKDTERSGGCALGSGSKPSRARQSSIFTYRVMRKLTAKAEYKAIQRLMIRFTISTPDKSDTAKVSFTRRRLQNHFRSSATAACAKTRGHGMKDLSWVVGGDETSRDRALGSVTVLVGKRSSVTNDLRFTSGIK